MKNRKEFERIHNLEDSSLEKFMEKLLPFMLFVMSVIFLYVIWNLSIIAGKFISKL